MLTTLTELDAVNQILSAIGSDPVTTLTDSTDIDVFNARRLLQTASRNVQRAGWDYNKTTRRYLPDILTGAIVWDDTLISLKSLDNNTYVKRGGLLYDITNNTFQFKKPIEVEIVYGVDFEDLPDCFKNYITASAAVDFQARYFGDTAVSQDLQFRLQEAHQDLINYDINMGNHNMIQMPSVSNVLMRT